MSDINTIKETIAGDYSQLSRVSILRHLQDIIVVAVWHLENLFGLHKTEIQALLDKNIPGTLGWYREKVLKFQYGDTVVLIDYRPGYTIEDIAKQIIKYAHIAEQTGGIVVKVAKEDRTILLTGPEEDALVDYIHNIKYPGTSVFIVNLLADAITVELDIWVNPQLIDSTGLLIGELDEYPVKEAIMNYINQGEFGGLFVIQDFIDVIQAVEGVEKVRLLLVEAVPYSQIPIPVIIFDLASGIDLTEYESEAGHLIIESNDLTINYY